MPGHRKGCPGIPVKGFEEQEGKGFRKAESDRIPCRTVLEVKVMRKKKRPFWKGIRSVALLMLICLVFGSPARAWEAFDGVPVDIQEEDFLSEGLVAEEPLMGSAPEEDPFGFVAEEELLQEPLIQILDFEIKVDLPQNPMVGDPTDTSGMDPKIKQLLWGDTYTDVEVTSKVSITDIFWSRKEPVLVEYPDKTQETFLGEGTYYLCMMIEAKGDVAFAPNVIPSINGKRDWSCLSYGEHNRLVFHPYETTRRRIDRVDLSLLLPSPLETAFLAGQKIDQNLSVRVASAVGTQPGLDMSAHVTVGAPVWYNYDDASSKPFGSAYYSEEVSPTSDEVFHAGRYILYLPLETDGWAGFSDACSIYLNGQELTQMAKTDEQGLTLLSALEVVVPGEDTTVVTLHLVLDNPRLEAMLDDYFGFGYGGPVPKPDIYVDEVNHGGAGTDLVTLGKPYWRVEQGKEGEELPDQELAGDKFASPRTNLCIDVESRVPISPKLWTTMNDMNRSFRYYAETDNKGILYMTFYTGKKGNNGQLVLEVEKLGTTTEDWSVPENDLFVSERMINTIENLARVNEEVYLETDKGITYVDLDREGTFDLFYDYPFWGHMPDASVYGAFNLDVPGPEQMDLVYMREEFPEYYEGILFHFPEAPPLETLDVILEQTDYTYTGKTIHPEPKVYLHSVLLDRSKYMVTYRGDCKVVGTYKVIVMRSGCHIEEREFHIVPKSLAKAKIIVDPKELPFNGKRQLPKIAVVLGKTTLVKDKDYSLKGSSNKNVGIATVEVTGIGNYKGTAKASFLIDKAGQVLEVDAKTVKVSHTKLKKVMLTLGIAEFLSVSGAKGKLSYAITSGPAGISIGKTSGKLTVKKGMPKGTYTVKVKVKAAATKNYKKATKTVTLKVKVK